MVKTKKHNIKIYTTFHCPWCKKTKEFLNLHNVKFKEIRVDEDQKAAEEMIEKSGQMGVPVIEIDGDIIIGYNPNALAKALGIKI